jgi:hypothetical protein
MPAGTARQVGATASLVDAAGRDRQFQPEQVRAAELGAGRRVRPWVPAFAGTRECMGRRLCAFTLCSVCAMLLSQTGG